MGVVWIVFQVPQLLLVRFPQLTRVAFANLRRSIIIKIQIEYQAPRDLVMVDESAHLLTPQWNTYIP